MSSGDNLAEFPSGGSDRSKHWYLDLSASTYDGGLSFLGEDGQTQGQLNSDFNFSLEPDEALDLELEPVVCIAESAFIKRHTMPEFGISPSCLNYQLDGLAQLASSTPKRAETYPSTIEGLNIVRNKKFIDGLDGILSKIDPETSSPSSDRGNSEPSDTNDVAQSMQVNPITDLGCDEWPVPTFFLDHIEGPTPPGLDRADDLTPEDFDNSPDPFGTIQPKDIEDNETNDYCSMAEDLDSVPPLNHAFVAKSGPHFKVTHSDSGIGSSTMSSRAGPQSIMGSSYRHPPSRKDGKSSRGSHAKGSVMFDRGSVAGSTTAGLYQQFAAKLGPLTSAASSTARSVETLHMLSETALKTMKTIILEPILNDSRFRDFWDICNMAGEQMESGQIGSLRDLEKFLFHKASNIKDNQAYNIFCKAFLNHVRESLQYMPQNELLRPYDRPYDPGYFLDTLAPFDKNTMQSTVFEVSQEEDQELIPNFVKWQDYTAFKSEKRVAGADDEHANAAKRHKPNRLELIIPTNDTQSYLDYELSALSNDAIRDIITPMSGNTGLMGPPPLPQVHSRNKGRRRGAGQQAKEQQLFPCRWPACTHEPFKRACDLTKHEKTHTRPHKCRVADCKYAMEGFPTEKERDRHWNDKHSPDTPNYHCLYPPCTYKSRRDTNCKQHMEKAHGYKYERMKQNFKTNGAQRQSISPTCSTGQGSPPAGSPPSEQQNFATPSSTTNTSQYQMTDFPISVNAVFPQSTQQYSRQDVEHLENLRKRLLMANQNQDNQFNYLTGGRGHAHSSENFNHQGYPQQNPAELPFPDAMDPSLLMYLPEMPVGNIDPHLQHFVNNEMDGSNNLSLGDTQELMPYSGLIT